MILETICRRSHVARVAPAVVTGEIAYWGSAADYCSRKDKDGRECEEAIVASRILMDSGRRIPVIASPAPGAVLRVSEAERIAHEPDLAGVLVDHIETVAQKLLDRGTVLDPDMAETINRLMEQGGEKLPGVAALIRTAEPEEIEVEPDEEQGCWHYDYTRFCTQCDPASYEETEVEEIEEPVAGPSFLELLRARVDGWFRRPATIIVGLLVGLSAVASLILTVLFALQGRWILALLV